MDYNKEALELNNDFVNDMQKITAKEIKLAEDKRDLLNEHFAKREKLEKKHAEFMAKERKEELEEYIKAAEAEDNKNKTKKVK